MNHDRYVRVVLEGGPIANSAYAFLQDRMPKSLSFKDGVTYRRVTDGVLNRYIYVGETCDVGDKDQKSSDSYRSRGGGTVDRLYDAQALVEQAHQCLLDEQHVGDQDEEHHS